MPAKIYLPESVFEAGCRRVAQVFDQFENIVVSVSGGKDSTALLILCASEAKKRGRRFKLFFLDQEAEYQGTIDVMRHYMALDVVEPLWFQVPLRMTNATSYADEFLNAWGPGEPWIREKEPYSIHAIEAPYPDRFYKFFDWMEKEQPPGTAFLVGLRSDESLNRYRAVTRNEGVPGMAWSSTAGNNSFKFYPLYDWGAGDVWKLIHDSRFPYNRIYDQMLRAGVSLYGTMRVSCLIHEKSFSCLTQLQQLEPDTFERLVARIHGVHVASIYAGDGAVFNATILPDRFLSWHAFRDYLLSTTPLRPERRKRFEERFAGQESSEEVYRQQVRQLLTNDWEGSLGTKQGGAQKRRANLEKWRAIL